MENDNSKDFDEIKQKKWIIQRIDLLNEIFIKAWDSDAKQFQNEGSKAVSTIKEWRTISLSAIVGILTIFLAYNSAYPAEPWIFVIVVSILIIIILAIFITFTKLITGVANLFGSIDSIYQDGIGHLSLSHGFVSSRGAFLLETDYAYWRNYFNFTQLLSLAIMVNHAKELRKLSKHYSLFPALKNNLRSEAKAYEVNVHLIPEYYSKFDQKTTVPPGLLDYVNKTLEKYRNQKR